MSKKRVLLIFGGVSTEHEVSRKSASSVFTNLDKEKYDVIPVGITKSGEWILYGGDSAKLIYVISDRHEAITKRVLTELDVGVTYLEGEGAYTHSPKKVVVCAMKNQIYPKVRQLVREEDPDAFLIVGQASEIFGEGFKRHDEPLQ